VHRVEVAGNHVVQLLVPFLLFLPQPVAGGRGVAIVVTQGWLVLSGNFAWLNLLTMLLALLAIPSRGSSRSRGAPGRDRRRSAVVGGRRGGRRGHRGAEPCAGAQPRLAPTGG
jgi:hypothetical protein